MPQFTLSVSETNWPEYKKYFLMAYPNQTLDSDNPLTDDQWIRHRIFLFAKGAYQKGKRQEFDAQNEPDFVDDIVL